MVVVSYVAPSSTFGGDVSISGTIHSPVRVHFFPVSTILPRYLTVTPILVNMTSHPALHSTMTDTSEYLLRPGMTWPTLPLLGIRGMFISPMCVECTLFPSGSVTVSGRVVSCFSVMGASVTKKFPVAPESSTAQLLVFLLLRPIVARMLLASWVLYLFHRLHVCFGDVVLG